MQDQAGNEEEDTNELGTATKISAETQEGTPAVVDVAEDAAHCLLLLTQLPFAQVLDMQVVPPCNNF